MIEVPGWHIEYYETLDSTMTVAAARPPKTAVVANRQTAGQGRHGHSWHSEPNTGLYVSMVLWGRPPGLPAITLALGLAAAEAIQKVTALTPDIRWPNDLLLSGKKVAGILVQAVEDRQIAGIGINVNHSAFPAPLDEEATSLRLQTGREHSREALLAALLPAVDTCCALPVEEVLTLFTHASSYASGRRVVVDGVEGVTAGLDESGFLRLRTADGSVRLILAGGVRATGA